MITISSKAGQRLAKAKAEYHEALSHKGESALLERDEFMAAACALANELIANGHHMTEGD